MIDLNSVLLEGVVQTIKPKRDHSGHWVEIRNRRSKDQSGGDTSHSFRVEIGPKAPVSQLAIGRRIRVVGTIRRASRLGSYIRAEHVEVRVQAEAVQA